LILSLLMGGREIKILM